MCGIIGIFNFNSQRDFQLAHAMSMANAMKHRGPNDEGFVLFQDEVTPLEFYGPDTPKSVQHAYPHLLSDQQANETQGIVTLGHRRLSILDLSPGGHQPMHGANENHWIVYNGEIYNYLELRDELKALGHHFKTESDTEVVLKAFQQWGFDCQNKFNGDWAFLIYEADKKKLFVSRDRFGVKPLYYYQDDHCIIFSSEIKGLLAHPAVMQKPNLDYLKNYLHAGDNEWIEQTAFLNIYRFPFAHSATISIDNLSNNWEAERYWTLTPNITKEIFDQEKVNQFSKQYYNLLKDAVRIRLRSDVPVGCALSGGLDSSSIVYLVNEIYKENIPKTSVKTFSLIHTEKKSNYCDESKFIYLLRDYLSLDSTFISPDIEDIPNLSMNVLKYWECPPDGLGMAGMFTTALAKKNGFVVTLDGQGADEQLAGYENYLANYLRELSGKRFFIEVIYLIRNFQDKSKTIRQIIWSLLPIKYKKIILEKFNKNQNHANSEGLNVTLKNSFTTGLVNLIHYSDSRAMYYSIESRMPFMDYRLVEFNASVPGSYKIHHGWTKYYARLAFNGCLPDEIVWRKDKMGWPVPDKQWLDGPLSEWYESIVKKSSILSDLHVEKDVSSSNKSKNIRHLNVAMFEKVFFSNEKV